MLMLCISFAWRLNARVLDGSVVEMNVVDVTTDIFVGEGEG